jgi:hypothetical protein
VSRFRLLTLPLGARVQSGTALPGLAVAGVLVAYLSAHRTMINGSAPCAARLSRSVLARLALLAAEARRSPISGRADGCGESWSKFQGSVDSPGQRSGEGNKSERTMVRIRREKPDADIPPLDGADAPVESLKEDRLGRRSFAEALAAEVMAAPVARGYVMGLTGAWGTGKTSILNMTADALGDKAIIVHFNPWMFSGTEALVSSFFAEIGKQLGKRDAKFKDIAGKLADYGRVLSPLATIVGASAAVTGAANILEKLGAAPSVFEQHRELRILLKQMDKRLIVIVDDVDRLRSNEILDIVRLVRLVGDFPNTLYLLAFDRGRVEECLGEGNLERGRAYLEKIVQVTHDVPIPRQPDVTALFVAGIQQIPDDIPTGPMDEGDLQNIFTFVVRPLLVTPRHVQRLLGSLPMTMRLVGDEVAFADLVGIEAVRVLHPALFAAIVSVADYLSAKAATASQGRDPRQRNITDSPIAPMHEVAPRLAENVCRGLFPAARVYFENAGNGPEWEATWRQQRKVASAAVLRFYLERQLPDGVVPARLVDEAVTLLSSRDELRQLFAGLSPEEVMDLIERMHLAIDEIPVDPDKIEEDPARIALPVMLDLLQRLPRGPWPIWLRRLDDPYESSCAASAANSSEHPRRHGPRCVRQHADPQRPTHLGTHCRTAE